MMRKRLFPAIVDAGNYLCLCKPPSLHHRFKPPSVSSSSNPQLDATFTEIMRYPSYSTFTGITLPLRFCVDAVAKNHNAYHSPRTVHCSVAVVRRNYGSHHHTHTHEQSDHRLSSVRQVPMLHLCLLYSTLGISVTLLTYGLVYGFWLVFDWPAPVQLTLAKTQKHEKVIEEMGDNMKHSWFWGGFVRDGHALIKLKFYGSNGSEGVAVCDCLQIKADGEWMVTTFNFYKSDPSQQTTIYRLLNAMNRTLNGPTERNEAPITEAKCPMTDDILASQLGHSVGVNTPTATTTTAAGGEVSVTSVK